MGVLNTVDKEFYRSGEAMLVKVSPIKHIRVYIYLTASLQFSLGLTFVSFIKQ